DRSGSTPPWRATPEPRPRADLSLASTLASSARNEAPDPDFLWVNPAAHPKRLVQVAALCRKIWRANQSGSIPYAFSPPNDCFDTNTGAFLFGPTRHGLTCASFVLAVFHHAGL